VANRLQKAPFGVLGLLELKVGGDNPTEFGGTLQPGADMLDYYTLDRSTVERATQSVQTDAQLATISVPTGQLWRIRAMSAVMLLPNTVTVNSQGVGLSCGTNANNSGGHCRLHSSYWPITGAVAVQQGIADTIYFERPLLLRQGNQCTGIFFGNLSAAVNLVFDVLFERILV
jgi:hypothetical protein